MWYFAEGPDLFPGSKQFFDPCLTWQTKLPACSSTEKCSSSDVTSCEYSEVVTSSFDSGQEHRLSGQALIYFFLYLDDNPRSLTHVSPRPLPGTSLTIHCWLIVILPLAENQRELNITLFFIYMATSFDPELGSLSGQNIRYIYIHIYISVWSGSLSPGQGASSGCGWRNGLQYGG
jgi:hypothetical protein